MPKETDAGASDWTTDTLRAYLQRQVDDLRVSLNERHQAQGQAIDRALAAAERATAAALDSAEKAVGKAEAAAERRFDSVNEFRKQLGDQAATFMPRSEAEVSIARTADRTQRVESNQANYLTRVEYHSAHERLIDQLRELADRINRSDGKGSGLQAGWQILVGAGGLIATFLAIYFALRH